jgi:hypothetical protein
MKLDQIYISHYEKLTDRKVYFDKIISTNPIFKGAQIVASNDEIDKRALLNSSYVDDKTVWHGLKNSEICIAEQMFRIYRLVAKSNNQLCLILEDDFVLTENFNHYLNEFLNNLPNDFDCIFMSSCCDLKPKHNNVVNKYFYEEETSRCTTAYLIKKETCEKILSIANYTAPIDWHLNFIKEKLGLKYYWTDPIIVLQGSEKDIYKSNLR